MLQPVNMKAGGLLFLFFFFLTSQAAWASSCANIISSLIYFSHHPEKFSHALERTEKLLAQRSRPGFSHRDEILELDIPLRGDLLPWSERPFWWKLDPTFREDLPYFGITQFEDQLGRQKHLIAIELGVFEIMLKDELRRPDLVDDLGPLLTHSRFQTSLPVQLVDNKSWQVYEYIHGFTLIELKQLFQQEKLTHKTWSEVQLSARQFKRELKKAVTKLKETKSFFYAQTEQGKDEFEEIFQYLLNSARFHEGQWYLPLY